MAFCPYCGKQLNDGEVCACTLAGVAGSGVQTASAQTPSAQRPSAGNYPAPPAYNPPPVNPVPQSLPTQPSYPAVPQNGAAPQSSFAPQNGYAPQSNYTPQNGAAPQSGYAPQSSFASQGQQAAPITDNTPKGAAPQSNFTIPQPEPSTAQQSYTSTAPQEFSAPAAPVQKKTSPLADIVNPLIDRVKLLFTADPNEAIERSIQTTDMSWALVYGAYVLLGTLAACFAVPKFIQGLFDGIYSGMFSYGDLLGELFGGVLWRSLFINVLTLVIALGTVMGVCGVTKSKLPFARALNLVSMAFVPAAALNAVGFIFSFFFPTGTILCGVLSAICTIVMLCVGLSSVSDRKGMWLYVIVASVMVLVYAFVVYLFMDAMVSDLKSNLISSMFW